MTPQVSVVIVSWNVREHLMRAIQSVLDHGGERVEIIVVDNNSLDGTLMTLKSRFPRDKHGNIALIRNTQNLGFAAACNQGLKKAQGDYVLFMNPDLELTPRALPELVSFLEKQPSVGIAAPQIRYFDDTIQPSCRRFPTRRVLLILVSKLVRFFAHGHSIRNYTMASFTHRTYRAVDQPMGACLLVRRTEAQEIGGWDERYFLWLEDTDFCHSYAKAGLITMFVPSVHVRHAKGRSFAQRGPLWGQWQLSRSAVRYAHKWFGIPTATSVLLVSMFGLPLALGAELLWRLGVGIKRGSDA